MTLYDVTSLCRHFYILIRRIGSDRVSRKVIRNASTVSAMRNMYQEVLTRGSSPHRPETKFCFVTKILPQRNILSDNENLYIMMYKICPKILTHLIGTIKSFSKKICLPVKNMPQSIRSKKAETMSLRLYGGCHFVAGWTLPSYGRG